MFLNAYDFVEFGLDGEKGAGIVSDAADSPAISVVLPGMDENFSCSIFQKWELRKLPRRKIRERMSALSQSPDQYPYFFVWVNDKPDLKKILGPGNRPDERNPQHQ
jgi:hypothetical protein